MIGSRIAALRRGAGLSQAQLAQQLKISPSAIGMYEQGRREPGAQMLAELSRLFGVSIDYLVTGKPELPADEQQLRSALEVVVESAQKQLGRRRDKPFTRQELTLLLTALLLEP